MAEASVNLNPALCAKVSEKFQRQLIKLAIGSIQQLNVNADVIESIRSENCVSESEFYDLIGMYTTIIKLFMESNKQEFEEKLISCGFTQQFLDSFPLKYENKSSVLTGSEGYNAKGEINLRYKLDISLNNDVLKNVVPPWVIIMLYNDNKNTTFSVDISTFHKLRYNVSLLLKELNRLKNSNVMKK